MGSNVRKNGPWVLGYNHDLTGLIDRLNTLLPPGAQVKVVEANTWNIPRPILQPSHADMSKSERVSLQTTDDATYIHIPLNARIVVPTRTLEWNGEHHPVIINIMGDFISISIPYLFKEEPDRVDVHEYMIITSNND